MSKNRVKKCRQNLYSDDTRHEAAKEKERERWKSRAEGIKSMRQKEKKTEEEKLYLNKLKEKEREKKRIQRARKKQGLQGTKNQRRPLEEALPVPAVSPIRSFRLKQAHGKAISKVFKSLPSSPNKAVATISGVIDRHPVLKVKFQQKGDQPQRKTRCDATPRTTKTMIKEFYLSDDISRALPGKRDVKTVRSDDGIRQQEQKRLILMTTREAWQLFQTEHEDDGVTVGLTTFQECRPEWVLICNTSNKGLHIQCCCTYCENLSLLLESYNFKFKKNLSKADALNLTLCNMSNHACCS